jgi:hypothetical protein
MKIINKFKDWLSKSNGWQRIWFVSTAFTFAYFVLIFPLIESNNGSSYRYKTKWAIEKELKKKECAEYVTQPFETLIEPEFDLSGDLGCYNIYDHRKYTENHNPINEKKYQNDFILREWSIFLYAMGLGILIAGFLSAIVYGIGFIFAWIVKGFHKTNH